mmetsp:Transcript_13511/g.32080  ORF Transcript_13511/g.32080 Transcript_13511/m.32080 type:complete len:267 (-) Transcript_13511:49-849(-)
MPRLADRRHRACGCPGRSGVGRRHLMKPCHRAGATGPGVGGAASHGEHHTRAARSGTNSLHTLHQHRRRMTRPLGPYGACPSRVGRHCPWGHDAHVPRRGRARHLVDPGSFPARRCRCQTLQGRGGAGSPAPLRLRRWCPRWGHSHSWSVCITWWACLSLCLTAGRTAPRRQFRLAGCAPTCARSRWLRVLSGEGGEVGVEILEPFQLSGDLRVDQLQVRGQALEGAHLVPAWGQGRWRITIQGRQQQEEGLVVVLGYENIRRRHG